jgi:hypothetical protein
MTMINKPEINKLLFKPSINKIFPLMHNYAILSLFISCDKLLKKYEPHIDFHNNKIISSCYHDSGFELLIPNTCIFKDTTNTQFINLKIMAGMKYYDAKQDLTMPTSFVISPLSSICKTSLVSSPEVQIINSGYRDTIICGFRNNKKDYFILEDDENLLQIYHPTLCPILVKLVNNKDELN